MKKIEKISDIDVNDVAYFLRLNKDDVDENERNLLETFLNIAKNRAVSYTGLTIEELDKIPEAVYAVLVACSDYYNNRSSNAAAKGTANSVFENVLGPYRVGRIGGI